MAGGFEALEVYREARRFRQRVFKLAGQLPSDEKFVLVSQMRRTALSLTNNIAEGHGSRSYRHNISYLYRSRGSLCELMDDIGVCEEEGYFKQEHLKDLHDHAEVVAKLLNGYIAYLRTKLDKKTKSDGLTS
jgi:four helix bundle protein